MDYHSITSFINSPDSIGGQPSPASSVGSPYSNAGSDEIVLKANRQPICCGCGKIVYDHWMLHVGDQPFHMSCLRCCVCLRTLDNHTSCYIRNNRVYCKVHYDRTKCAGCGLPLSSTDWIRRALDSAYHVHCFRCHHCRRTLDTGDKFVVKGDHVLCTEHSDTHVQIDDTCSVSSADSDSRYSESSDDKPTKKGRGGRATFTREQSRALADIFQRSPMPSSDEMDDIIDIVGHPRKVIQVWFQNARARVKKSQQLGMSKTHKLTGSWNSQPCSPASLIVIE